MGGENAFPNAFFAFASQLCMKIGPKLPFKSIFHRFYDPPNLDFCNTLQCFSWFFIFQANHFQDASQVPFELQKSVKMPLKSSQEAPKKPPRAPKIAPRVPKILTGEAKRLPRGLLELPRRAQELQRGSQEGSKMLPTSLEEPLEKLF